MLSICLVGHKGYWGPKLLRNLEKNSRIKVTALVDMQAGEEEREEKSLKDALAMRDFDAVVIATPPETHYSVAKEALLAGKHVLVEKPLTTTLKDAQALVRLAAEKNLKLGVDHTFLFSSHIRQLRKLIQAGKIGDILHVVSRRLNFGKFQLSGVIWDLAPHDLAVMDYLFGSDFQVSAVVSGTHLQNDVVDTATIHIEYKTGMTYGLDLSWLNPKKDRTTTVVGTNGMIEYDMLSDSPLIIYDKAIVGIDRDMAHRYSWMSIYEGEVKEPLALLVDEFADWILLDKPFVSPGSLGMRVVGDIEDILKKC